MSKESVLTRYVPSQAVPIIERWIQDSPCEFRITKRRASKYGDYRHPYKKKGHRISVNGDLNPYAFLVTTVHEFAHLKTWQEHGNRVKPHGVAWKNNFRMLMEPFLLLNCFPPDIKLAVVNYLENPRASSCSDLDLFKVLHRSGTPREGVVHLEMLPEKAVFAILSGRKFEKGVKLRKRYRCVEQATGRVYLFNPLAEVYI